MSKFFANSALFPSSTSSNTRICNIDIRTHNIRNHFVIET